MGMITNAFKSFFKTITKLSRPYFTLEENQLKFKIDSDNFYLFSISNIETKSARSLIRLPLDETTNIT